MNSTHLLPFLDSWTPPRAFEDEFVLGSIRGRALTLESESVDYPGLKLQSTACSIRLAHRARIELIRRAAVAQASFAKQTFPFRELDPLNGELFKEPMGDLDLCFFDQSACRNSGVAVHYDPAAACALAWNDLVLSDRVLRSWYGGIPPRFWTEIEHLGPEYVVEAYYFAGSSPTDVDPAITVGIFAFASESAISQGAAPLLFGFGVSQGHDSALQRAYDKLLAFGACKNALPDWLLEPEGLESVREWLEGKRAARPIPAVVKPVLNLDPSDECRFVDITPAGLREPLSIVRAICPSRMVSTGHSIPLHPVGVA